MRDAITASLSQRLTAQARKVPEWCVYIVGALPAPWLFWQALTGALGVEPIEALEHEYGRLALQLLLAGLAVTPLWRLTGVNLVKFRRPLGLLAFFYLCLHFLVWLLLDVQILSQAWADIVKRPFITIGMAGFLLLVPLAVTSTRKAIRRMGPKAWGRLHRLVYVAVGLGVLHFVMGRKGLQYEPLVYAGILVVLLGLRLVPRRR
ncbi:protein-methionine-sulfoxide reductase heme-binding subunit MsrQ [Marinibacterium profundimaris]|uniref:protein-methionine-sulfoxide reductase heme-binding subunit MsrQ n=1 Tax=Marinibacterium profundimaris TaxID=1679460 RepID=UPI001E34BBB2|nr:protein-methionine-sulfoxide reductase heme-binding subunit MsrQ [Marinibacterium profundimaris]